MSNPVSERESLPLSSRICVVLARFSGILRATPHSRHQDSVRREIDNQYQTSQYDLSRSRETGWIERRLYVVLYESAVVAGLATTHAE